MAQLADMESSKRQNLEVELSTAFDERDHFKALSLQ
jgi:hypothetical protein